VSHRRLVLQLLAVEMLRIEEGGRAVPAIRRASRRASVVAPVVADLSAPVVAARALSACDPVSTDIGTADPKVAPPTFAYLYRSWYGRVVRWLGSLGAPKADIEDLAQDVFLVVRRRLPDFDGRNEAGWLYRIASGQVRQHRRRFVFRSLVPSREPIELEEIPHDRPSVLADMETKQKQELLDRILSQMSEKRRVVFLLFEMQGYSGSEIAGLLDVPVNTIKTRLFHARKDFVRLLAEHRGTTDVDR
jgi:RNA polymerase sigma-70 factor, ECF subfamily